MKFVNHLGNKILLPVLFDIMLCEIYKQEPQKNYWPSFLKKVRESFELPASWKSLQDILQDTEESDW